MVTNVKTDSEGNTEWKKPYNHSNYSERGFSLDLTQDGGFIITGDAAVDSLEIPEVFILKADVNGDEEWYKTYGVAYSARGNSIQQTSDGGYIITGTKFESLLLTKTDSQGNTED